MCFSQSGSSHSRLILSGEGDGRSPHNVTWRDLADHNYQMHDETFLVIKGTATFTSRTDKIVAKEGDYVVVPPYSPHTFGNESDEECVLYNTFTPAWYINYFRLMQKMVERTEDRKLTPAIAKEAMLHYATVQTDKAGEYELPVV